MFVENLIALHKSQIVANLKKCQFFPKPAEFVGVEIEGEGGTPAALKFPALANLAASPPAAAMGALGLLVSLASAKNGSLSLKSECIHGENTRRILLLPMHLRESRPIVCAPNGWWRTNERRKSWGKSS